MDAALDIASPVVYGVSWILFLGVLFAELFALVHSIIQRSDAFTAAGKLTKPAWIGINLVAVLLTLVFAMPGTYAAGAVLYVPSLFGLIAIVAALVYLVDVRPAIREITGGGPSSW